MRRREFIALLCGCGTTAAWPAALRAEDRGRVARVGSLSLQSKGDPMSEFWDAEFRRRLNELGWIEGRNIDIQSRWAEGDLDRVRTLAKELVALNPNVLVGTTTPATAALQHETQTIRSYLPPYPIPSAAVSSKAWPSREAISPASYSSKPR
jgi:hypothetical protein